MTNIRLKINELCIALFDNDAEEEGLIFFKHIDNSLIFLQLHMYIENISIYFM